MVSDRSVLGPLPDLVAQALVDGIVGIHGHGGVIRAPWDLAEFRNNIPNAKQVFSGETRRQAAQGRTVLRLMRLTC